MTTQQAATGLLANIPRIEAKAKLQMIEAMSIARSGKIDANLLRTAGYSQAEIGYIELEAHKAEQMDRAMQGA